MLYRVKMKKKAQRKHYTCIKFPEKLIIAHGPDEIDLVHSGLEETMITATREIMEIWKANPAIPDMRSAAYVCAINKVAL